MALAELKAQNPELLKEMTAELVNAQAHELAAKMEEAAANARKETLALIKALGGAEIAQKAETLLAANITTAQLEALAPLLAKPEAAQPDKLADPEAKARAEMLDAINAATGQPLPAAKSGQQKSALMADAERRAQAASRQ